MVGLALAESRAVDMPLGEELHHCEPARCVLEMAWLCETGSVQRIYVHMCVHIYQETREKQRQHCTYMYKYVYGYRQTTSQCTAA